MINHAGPTSFLYIALLTVATPLAALGQLSVDKSVVKISSTVLDIERKTLNISGEVQNLGGKTTDLQIKETKTEIKVELSGDILFDFDKWDLRSDAEPALSQVADLIKKYQKPKIMIEGYTDSKGDDSYNLRLSQKRAQSVKNWLSERAKISTNTVSTKGWGEQRPVALNSNPDGTDNPDGRQKNRRVEITIKKG